MIQGGDPTGTGRGGESIYGYVKCDMLREPGLIVVLNSGHFEDEIDSTLKHTGAGIVSMVHDRFPICNWVPY